MLKGTPTTRSPIASVGLCSLPKKLRLQGFGLVLPGPLSYFMVNLPKLFSSKSPSKEDRSPSPTKSPRKKSPRSSHHSSPHPREPSSPSKPALKRSSKSYRTSRDSYNENSHPLNLPPEELRRLTAMAAASEPMPMGDDQRIPSSPPPSAPGAFPSTNGYDANQSNEDAAPQPPPHRTASSPASKPTESEVDAEACKAAGNKFFKAQQYSRAIAEYTKGERPASNNTLYICFSNTLTHEQQ